MIIKKIFIVLFLTILITSCGKKDDPVYNGKGNFKKLLSTQQSTLA